MNEISRLNLPKFADTCILSEGLRIGNLDEVGKEDAVEVSPCTSERGNVMAEIDLSDGGDKPFLDIDVFCFLLESYERHFAESKCEQELGFGKVVWKAHNIHVYENGKFKVQQAHDREDAIRSLNSITRLVFSSILCNDCGRPAIDCALGKCGSCVSETSHKIVMFEDYFNAPMLRRGFDSLMNSLQTAQETVTSGEERDANFLHKMERQLHEATEYAMNFNLESENLEGLTMGTLLIALAKENLRLLKILRVLTEFTCEKASKYIKNSFDELDKYLWEYEVCLVDSLTDESYNESLKLPEASKRIEKVKKLLEKEEIAKKEEIKEAASEIEEVLKTIDFWMG